MHTGSDIVMEFSILLSNNNRSKAYLQNLIKNGFVPKKAIILEDKGVLRPENTLTDIKSTSESLVKRSHDASICFDEGQHVKDTLDSAGIDRVVLETMNVNSTEVISAVAGLEGDYVVYSGPGGAILRKEILGVGKDFIHVHPGWLPTYRGSTTMYYSLLVNRSVSCSVFLMREALDDGPLLHRRTFQINEHGVDFDYVLDPAVRTATLIDFFSNSDEMLANPLKPGNEESNTFYIIHPVLKHLSILTTKGELETPNRFVKEQP